MSKTLNLVDRLLAKSRTLQEFGLHRNALAVLNRVAAAEALDETGQAEEACEILRLARFRHPRDGRFQKLWHDRQFRQLRQAQRAAPPSDRTQQGNKRSMLLPFLRPLGESLPGGR